MQTLEPCPPHHLEGSQIAMLQAMILLIPVGNFSIARRYHNLIIAAQSDVVI